MAGRTGESQHREPAAAGPRDLRKRGVGRNDERRPLEPDRGEQIIRRFGRAGVGCRLRAVGHHEHLLRVGGSPRKREKPGHVAGIDPPCGFVQRGLVETSVDRVGRDDRIDPVERRGILEDLADGPVSGAEARERDPPPPRWRIVVAIDGIEPPRLRKQSGEQIGVLAEGSRVRPRQPRLVDHDHRRRRSCPLHRLPNRVDSAVEVDEQVILGGRR